MPYISNRQWSKLERWTPTLFLVGFALELLFALNHGAAYLVESVSFYDWIYPSVIVGRVAVLLGLAGLSVRLKDQIPRWATLGRVILGGAIVFSVGLIVMSILDALGISSPIIAVFGIGTVVLTILSFVFFGVAGIRTDAYPTVIGGLMLVSTLALLFVLLTSATLSTNVRGAVGEGLNSLVFLVIWYILRNQSMGGPTTDPSSEPSLE